MRRALFKPTGQEYLAENVTRQLSDAPKGDWRCPNPACGEACTHVMATENRVAFFKHVVGVADLETCYYFAEETPTRRHRDCVALLEGELIHRYGAENVKPEAWVEGVSYPLDVLVERPGGQQWGFWYVSPRRTSMTVNLLKQAAAAGVLVTIFTHVNARKPTELFEAKGQPSFFLEPDTGMLMQRLDHKDLMAPIEQWSFGEDGLLIRPTIQEPPTPATYAARPPAPGAPTQAVFFTDPQPEPPRAVRTSRPSDRPTPVQPAELPPKARGRVIWETVDQSQLPGDLAWIIQGPASEWAPQLLDWFLSKPTPFRISQACQFIGQRWRLHPSLFNQHDLVFLRAMHGFWQLIEQLGHVRIVEHPHPIYVYPVRHSEVQ